MPTWKPQNTHSACVKLWELILVIIIIIRGGSRFWEGVSYEVCGRSPPVGSIASLLDPPLIIIIILAHQHNAAGMKTKVIKNKNNDHDGVSHGVKCSQEGDRIPLFGERNGQSL